MQESVTRSLSGVVYIALLLSATLFSQYSFSLLFGIFMLICVVEFCKLIHLKSSVPILLALLSYVVFVFFSNSNTKTDFLLTLATFFVSINLILDLFIEKLKPREDKISKFVKLFGYIILPFVLLMKMPLISGDFNPKMISITRSLGAQKCRTLITYRKLFDSSKVYKRHPILTWFNICWKNGVFAFVLLTIVPIFAASIPILQNLNGSIP